MDSPLFSAFDTRDPLEAAELKQEQQELSFLEITGTRNNWLGIAESLGTEITIIASRVCKLAWIRCRNILRSSVYVSSFVYRIQGYGQFLREIRDEVPWEPDGEPIGHWEPNDEPVGSGNQMVSLLDAYWELAVAGVSEQEASQGIQPGAATTTRARRRCR